MSAKLKNQVQIAPSILSADFSRLGEEIIRADQAGADLIHLDIMDGHFVPNLTFGPPVVAAVRQVTKLPFDVHLMVENPQDLLEPFAASGADLLTVHAESSPHLNRLLSKIKELGLRAGIALNPSTPLAAVEEVLDLADMVLLMSVNPGFGGQKFIAGTVEKVRRLRKMIAGRSIDIEIDGGVNKETAAPLIAAGANILVAGSAVYGASDLKKAIAALRSDC
ncbi:MAG: ribulose-phosphate 3-epimerase [Sporomusaceae bacterium]|jgi:ribulose-phosphate 3-epimerase|nr:ribulose-phosphate 3-epimerase [Sporomusaceae bacterium]